MRQRGVPFCAGLAARTRHVTWPAAYALPFRCPSPGRMRMRDSFNPLSSRRRHELVAEWEPGRG
jgi:hypothetical protein